MHVIGWDIGGVNTKVARVAARRLLVAMQRPFELQRAPGALVSVLRELAAATGDVPPDAHAVTMTAELSQMFRTKRDGVAFVLDAIEAAFTGSAVHVFLVGGTFVAPRDARLHPLAAAASNWAATAHLVARHHADALLVDVGTTTTDIIPIAAGRVAAAGRTDPDRLASGELVYSGAVRTPVEAIAAHVPLGDGMAGVSAEGFALSGDVHVWRGDLDPAEYTAPTPDGRPPTRGYAGERLARVVCGDRESLDDAAVSAIADSLAAAQVGRIADAMRRVVGRHPSIDTAIVTGGGAFLGTAAARACALRVQPLSARLGDAGALCAPAASVALLLEEELSAGPVFAASGAPGAPTPDLVVVKVGGGLLAHDACFDAVLAALNGSRSPVVIVPGGGPFADAVREEDARRALADEAAHWMAVLGMDQYAHLIASRLSRACLVEDRAGVDRALRTGRPAVLAPYRWLRAADPVPHSWEVTSDSIAAWVAGALGARRLVLVKPPGASGEDLVDGCFSRLTPPGVQATVVTADRLDVLEAALGDGTRGPGSSAAR